MSVPEQWIYTPVSAETRPYFVQLNRAKRLLESKGFTPRSEVWLTEETYEGEVLDHPVRTKCMFGWVAADRIAQKQFRLATPEEIENEKREAKERAEACAAIEAANRRESSLRMTEAFVEATKQLGLKPRK